MGDETLVKVEDVSKKFCRNLKRSLWYGVKDIASELLGRPNHEGILRRDEFWAVRNVSFELRRGECLGVIGHNGAGKSTLLKMLNGLIKPDKGTITMKGRIGALIELGAGFNPILTGRENIYNNGAVLGFSKNEIDRKFDAIVDFADIDEFIDTPLQNYSSGMKVRLGFAVAAQMEPDVLIIDEVLAVGDMAFVLKCFNTIDQLLRNSAIIFVTHNMPQVSRICSELMLLEKGVALFHGKDVSAGIDTYYSNHGKKITDFARGSDAELVDIEISSKQENLNKTASQEKITAINRLDDLNIHIKFKVVNKIQQPFISIIIYDREQRPVGVCYNEQGLNENKIYQKENNFNFFSINLRIPEINLSKGLYSITVAIMDGFRSKPLLRAQAVKDFQVFAKHDTWEPIEFVGIWE